MILYFMAVGLPFLILMILGPVLIKILKQLNYGQQVRGQGPKSHLKKEGIPTMGGILIILAILLSALIVLELNVNVIWVLFIILGMGLIGFWDDFIKIRTQKSLGLKARHKIVGQLLLSLLLALYIYYYSDTGSIVFLPFRGQISLGIWIIPFVMLTVTGTVNAVNITDGLDGLASGVTAVVSSALSVLLFVLNYQQLGLLGFVITGACIGFIWYNSHPAQVFMGDVGSLALGGALSAMAVLSGTEIYLLVLGLVFVIETVSVIIQVIYFRLTGGKRVFRMTPLHHHYELQGMQESKIVARFFILSMFFASLGILMFYMTI
ncbi:MAG: phospho-N-acetylmuramoyl-pentapeptide-transferase [Halanaerobiaceae bacterium]